MTTIQSLSEANARAALELYKVLYPQATMWVDRNKYGWEVFETRGDHPNIVEMMVVAALNGLHIPASLITCYYHEGLKYVKQ